MSHYNIGKEGRQAAVMCEATDDGHVDVMASHWFTCCSTLDEF
uniref:Uncharacterized protein n=1 Tax=Salix viminalis TaxID=40686 RepID=A0A6N2LIE8_SALVM